MTPKEKANQIYYENLEWVTDAHIYKKRNIISITAKRCSLITIDHIMSALKELNTNILHTNYGQKLYDINGEVQTNYTNIMIYYTRVKDEINNL